MKNPVIWADYPDLDVIRVDDTYYMVSTTMHMFPGCAVLRSYDLLHWEMASYVYDSLGETDAQKLQNGNIYGKGMWAASLRYHKGLFHVVFCANDTHRMYHYTAAQAEGPWTRHQMEGFYHDSSVLFDDDGRVYIVYGNRQIHLTELTPDLSRPLKGGLDRIIVTDTPDASLGYEGSHLLKIHGRYYLFLIHWMSTGHKRRTEAVYSADSPEGEWTGKDCLDDDMGFHNCGVAQGGIIDTPEGEWYAMLFQDHGAVGRVPVVVPVRWEKDLPVMGPVPRDVEITSTRPGHVYAPLIGSDDFSSGKLASFWQWNHEPDLSLVTLDSRKKRLILKSGRLSDSLPDAPNTLTQRTFGPGTRAEVTVDASGLNEGDFAGICALQGLYAQAGVRKCDGAYLLSWIEKTDDGIHEETVAVSSSQIRLAVDFDFEDMKDLVVFHYLESGRWTALGRPHQLEYRLDHFMGCRVGLYCYSTCMTGGEAAFLEFQIDQTGC